MRALGLLVCAVVLTVPAPVRAQSWLERLSGPREAERLASPTATLRVSAAEALGHRGDPDAAVRVLTAALPSERDVAVREAIMLALARRGDPDAVAALVVALQSSEQPGRATAARALGAFDTAGSIRALVEALGQDEVRQAARLALTRVGGRAVPALVRASRDPALRPTAVEVLGDIADPRSTAALVEALGDRREHVRIVALRAIAATGDERAGPAVAKILTGQSPAESSPGVVLAALETLARVGSAADVPMLRRRVETGPVGSRRAALSALFVLDPSAAIPLMEAAVASADHPLGHSAVELALTSTDPRVVSLLYGLFEEGGRAAEAASALAELESGAGLGVLVRLCEADGPHRDHATRALAVALRRWAGEVDAETAALGRRLLTRAPGGTQRVALLRALALDPDVGPPLRQALRSEDPAVRAGAAQGLGLLGDETQADAVAAALLAETDPESFRRLAEAAATLRAPVPIRSTWRWMARRETAPEAMRLAASLLGDAPPSSVRRVRVELRRGLRDTEPRVRAGAARALAIARDRTAWRALRARLDDLAWEVRRAVAYALEVLAVEEVRPALAARWRVEDDVIVEPMLRDAMDAPRRRSRRPDAREGTNVLRVRVVAASLVPGAVSVDVLLPDASWMRTRTLDTGELIVADLPAGAADVRVRLDGT